MSRSIHRCRKGAGQGSIPNAATQLILKMRIGAIGATRSKTAPGPEAVASSNVQKRGRLPDCRGRFYRDAPKIPCSSVQPASQTWRKEDQQ